VVGRRWASWVEILEGIAPSQAVVADGSFLLKSDVLRAKMGAGCATERECAMKLALFLLGHRPLVLLATAVLLAAGTLAWSRLPIDAFPDVTSTQVMILSKAPGLAAVDVEERVSYPIEQAMRGLPRVTQVRSLSRAGLSQVVHRFEDGVDASWTRQVGSSASACARAAPRPAWTLARSALYRISAKIFQYTLEARG
jgi:cobalt-zinc-cadmium resistance protein CzcA